MTGVQTCALPICEDGGAVAVPVRVDDFDRVVEVARLDDAECRAKDLRSDYRQVARRKRRREGSYLLLVSLHRGVNFENGGADKVAVRVSGNGDAPAVKRDLAAIALDRGD